MGLLDQLAGWSRRVITRHDMVGVPFHGTYLTDGIALFRVEGVLQIREKLVELEDCMTLEVIVCPARRLGAQGPAVCLRDRKRPSPDLRQLSVSSLPGQNPPGSTTVRTQARLRPKFPGARRPITDAHTSAAHSLGSTT